METNIITQEKKAPLPPLIKQSATYKLYVPRKVEEKIRYLCRKYPSLEWSGVLFYTHTGTFEDNNLEIHCEDIYPMDLGSATFTKFQNDETIVGYVADNIDLFQCDMGLIHSHNRMSCWFSGTDTSTLQSEGNDTNCFVSLIVNNEGTYCAAITRKKTLSIESTVKRVASSYEFFGEGEVKESGNPVETTEKTETTSIEYFMLDVEREIVDNPFDFLDKRFEEIEKQKNPPKTLPLQYPLKEDRDEDFYSWIHSDRKKSAEAKEALLFDEDTMKEMEVYPEYPEWQPDPDIIRHYVYKIVTLSLTVSKDFDLSQWITRHMSRRYDEIFSDSSFKEWAEFIIDFLINQYTDPSIPMELVDTYDIIQSRIANALYEELDKYPENAYLEQYKEILTRYIYE